MEEGLHEQEHEGPVPGVVHRITIHTRVTCQPAVSDVEPGVIVMEAGKREARAEGVAEQYSPGSARSASSSDSVPESRSSTCNKQAASDRRACSSGRGPAAGCSAPLFCGGHFLVAE
ncbi:hypothetical protein SFRURICE_013824 [Spodoptera frugiperda]|nr:hypothetical protein SFRURICE_013824 [Spodoptera frugiperda]